MTSFGGVSAVARRSGATRGRGRGSLGAGLGPGGDGTGRRAEIPAEPHFVGPKSEALVRGGGQMRIIRAGTGVTLEVRMKDFLTP